MAAQLLPIDLVSPGFRGVNFEEAQNVLQPHWATVAQNAVLDQSGRVASRRGYSDVTTTAVTGDLDIKTLFEYIREGGADEIIVAWDDAGGAGIANDIDDPEANIIDGTVVVTDGSWWFQNYNDKCIGFIDGQKPIVYNGTGTFATVVEGSGTAPTSLGGVGMCAGGRVWGVDSDGQVIKFTGLLDETNWGGAGSGSIDMQNIWTKGTDIVTAITMFNGALVVFGKRHIVIWVDGVGNQLGIDPDNLYVSDVIEGTGCISQWSLQNIGEADLLFLSRNGVQSLGRVLASGGSAGINTMSSKVTTQIEADIEGNAANVIRSVVSDGMYIISFPTTGRSYTFAHQRPFQTEEGETLFPITTWDLAPTAWLRDTGNARLLLGYAGNVGLYGGADTDAGTAFTFSYESSWLDLGEGIANRLKLLKRIGSIVFTQSATTMNFKWDFDFKGSWTSKSKTFASGGGAEWGIAEWNVDEWAGGISLRIIKIPATGTGQYIKVGVSVEVASQVSIQQLEIFSKLGRVA
jgi:hypothetical protein